jgi:uroporphyrinogen-III synthase
VSRLAGDGRGGPLAGAVVAVTRPVQQADGQRLAIEKLGGIARMFPLIETHFCDREPLQAALVREPELLVFTSPAGVLAYERAGLRVQAPAACVGPRTAAAAAGAELAAFAPDSGYAAEELLHVLSARVEWLRGRRVLVVRGDLAEPVLRDGLRGLGAIVEDVVAYRTVRTPQADALAAAVAAGEVDALTFASGSAVSAFASAWRSKGGAGAAWPQSVAVAVLGPRTESVARSEGIPVHATAGEATAQGLAGALAAYYTMGENKGDGPE